MIIADLNQINGRIYPARRRTQNLVGGASPIQASNFAMGNVTLEPRGGQVPWHNQEQEEIYFIVEGTCEMCLGEERQTVTAESPLCSINLSKASGGSESIKAKLAWSSMPNVGVSTQLKGPGYRTIDRSIAIWQSSRSRSSFLRNAALRQLG